MFRLLGVILFLLFTSFSFGQENPVINLLEGWKFKKGEEENGQRIDLNDDSWEIVSIPHDWAIKGPFIPEGDGNTGKLPWKGEAWYRLNFDIPNLEKEKRYYLLIDGIMSFPKVYVNGKLAGKWDYGYNSFYLDITNFNLKDESNLLAIHADTRNHDSRWYPGAGIYRKIQLIEKDDIHMDVWGNFITTPILKPHYADVRVSTSLSNYSASEEKSVLLYNIYNNSGRLIKSDSLNFKILNNKKTHIENTISIIFVKDFIENQKPHLVT